MDVGSILGALTGGGNLKIDIQVNPPQTASPESAVILDHNPSWRLHKNPFWRVKHPPGDKFSLSRASVAPQPPQQPYGYNNNPPVGHTMPSASYMGGSSTGSMMAGTAPQNPYVYQQPQQQQQLTTTTTIASSDVQYAFEASQDISGTITLRLPPGGKKCEHLGIKVQFIGRIDMTMGIHEGRPHYDFTSLSKELAPPGTIYQQNTTLPFYFKNMDKEMESYAGRNVAVRYIIKVLMERKFLPPLTKEHDVWVQLLGKPPAHDEAIKMEVGIEDCLHIEFEFSRRNYSLQDTIVGEIRFLLVRIKIKHMELAVLRRETSGEGVALAAAAAEGVAVPAASPAVDASNIYTETQTLVKYEIMDGEPVKGEVIPVKLCLKGIPADLTPTYNAGNNRFSVRYFLNLVLVDEDDRRYFKQQEIILWRKQLG